MSPIIFFLVSVGTVTGIATILAVIMVIADATIANYGTVKITINDKKEMEVDGGKSILSTLMEKEIFIPSACGGRGSCGLCKVKVTEGMGDYLPTELSWITPEEQKQNIRLSCQCKVKRDIFMYIPEELFNVRQFRTQLISLKDLTHDIKEVKLKLIEPNEISFSAGQFIQFMVPAYELTDEPVYRAYSIASTPSNKNEIDLEIRYVPNGICTTYVFKYLKEGDEVTINGAYGEFYLRDTDRNIIMIAGGSGNAPIRSILMKMKEDKNPRKAMYFFGARSVRDLFLVDEMRELEKEMPNFTYVPALSSPLPEDNWTGEVGLITEVVDKFMGPGENTEAYLCGSPGMIDACIKVLTKNGIPEDRIYYDKFA